MVEHLPAPDSEPSAAVYARVQREGAKRLAFTMVVLAALFTGSFFVPYGLRIFTAIGLAYPLWGYVTLMPGRCGTCGVRTVSSMTRDGQVRIPAWWDLRPMSRKGLVWYCPPHMFEYMMRRAETETLERRANE